MLVPRGRPLTRGGSSGVAQVVSTHQVESFIEEPLLQTKQICKVLLYCVLLQAVRLHICENADCLMNNADSIDEMTRVPIALCPTCMRKLHLMGVVDDVPATHARVARFLAEKGLGNDGFGVG